MIPLRQAFRQLTLHVHLSVVVIVMLAVGIGGTTALFAVFYEVELETLPVAAPEELVNLRSPGEKPGYSRPSRTVDDAEAAFSYPLFRDLEADQTAFTGLAAHYDFMAQLTQGTQTTGGRGLLVSGRYFDVLNLQPAIGRLIGPQDTPRVGESDIVVLSGLYGVLSYNMARRTREFGLRLALGAAPDRLLIDVLKQVATMALIGVGIGLVAAIALGRVVGAMLYGLSGYDPVVLTTTVAVISLVVLGAGYVPARRASKVEPMQALRYE
jgi:hypothetical protein